MGLNGNVEWDIAGGARRQHATDGAPTVIKTRSAPGLAGALSCLE